ncbi:MAG: pyruvate, water dikinase [Candidatus Abyssobacteria bacterium SURF_17]|uniref:Phosphoenolpyruvate synthase n=1 Tax=Candidatus Abyssobacteria bacterium SURF_17 TaxID=2093361 RepID=A0A419EY44_9BACT|nr:MAG: pyruvate, water dikinase [Candidatus Abyssubacteria bacterium SURF_17]
MGRREEGNDSVFLQKIRALFQHTPAAYQPEFSTLFSKFQQILQGNNAVLEIIGQMEDKLSGEYVFDINYIRSSCETMSETVYKIIYALNILSNNNYPELFSRYEAIHFELSEIVEGKRGPVSDTLVIPTDKVTSDMEELVGSKSARLGEVRNNLGMSTPDGFIITTAAYRLFMESNGLWAKIRKILEQWRAGAISAAERSGRIEELFERAAVPSVLEKEISQAVSALFKRLGGKARLAVRSSAWGEDSELRSFAGQFRTLLNQGGADIPGAYKKVLASRFSESVLAYGGDEVFEENHLPVAVACQEMIPATVSGIAYTIDPTEGSWDRALITALFGLGEPGVSGRAEMDHYYVARIHPFDILERRIGVKRSRTVAAANKNLREEAVSEAERTSASLTDEQVLALTQSAMTLERYFRQPQDIEWAIGGDNKLVILQSRPLSMQRATAKRSVNLTESLRGYPVLLSDKGQIVQRGVAAGKVVRVQEDDDPTNFPQGAIAVTHFTSPRLTKIIRKTSAILTDVGSPTGHMATIAREFGVPTIVGTEKATEVLEDGMNITVDAEENKVYEGIVPEVLEYQIEGRDQFASLPEFKILRRVLGKVAPLNLIDPTSAEFTARNCQTYHDILRFCHEQAVWELINLHTSEKRFRNVKSRELKLPIPIGLYIIDISSGLSEDVGPRTVDSIEQVKSVPMRAILEGLTAPGAWSTEPKALGFNDFMSSLTRFSLTDAQPRYAGKNLAVISDRYANLSLRLGYHFNVVDTYLSENINDNYIYFRFVGGVTEPERRYRRGLLIRDILEKYDFKATLKNDLVVARLKKRGQREMRETLVMLGKLIGFTRQLDTEMTSNQSIERYTAAFLEGERLQGGE